MAATPRRALVEPAEDQPVLLDRYLRDAIEVDVDALADGTDVIVAGDIYVVDVLPRVGRQLDRRPAAVQPRPVDRHAVRVQLAERRVQRRRSASRRSEPTTTPCSPARRLTSTNTPRPAARAAAIARSRRTGSRRLRHQ